MKNISTKLMLLGITLIGIALYIQGEPGIKFYGNEFFILVIGSIISFIGFLVENRINYCLQA
jgi:hypothetical protein